ncbi:MAG: hypothetical protein IKK29_01985, partial [Christensenellaceae bacterium]|nr:hypothetical protein [Christensenellaceae bacterium]
IYLYNNIFHYIDWGVSMREILPYYLLYSYLFPIVGMVMTDIFRKLFQKIGTLFVKQNSAAE